MSSAYNHMKRSHRSEKHKASAFRGFKPAQAVNRNKYTNGFHFKPSTKALIRTILRKLKKGEAK